MKNTKDLTRNEQAYIKRAPLMKALGVLVAIVGIMGILLGMYQLIYGSMPHSERQLTVTLICYSIGFFIMGYILYQAFIIVEKLVSTS